MFPPTPHFFLFLVLVLILHRFICSSPLRPHRSVAQIHPMYVLHHQIPLENQPKSRPLSRFGVAILLAFSAQLAPAISPILVRVLQIIIFLRNAPTKDLFVGPERPYTRTLVQPRPHFERHRFRFLQCWYYHIAVARETHSILLFLMSLTVRPTHSVRDPPQRL